MLLPASGTVRQQLGFYLLLAMIVTPVVLGTIRSNDLWKALYSGRYLAEYSRFPHHSTFTFSPVEAVQERDAYNWLGNLVLYGVHRGAGERGLQGLRVYLVVLVLVLVHRRVGFHRSSFLLLVLAALVFGLHQKLLLRNAVFALPGMTLLVWIWLKAQRDRDPAVLWGLPVLMVLWSNIHGSYLAGLGILTLLVVGEILRTFTGEPVTSPGWVGRCLGILILCGIVTVIVKPFPDTTGWTYLERLGSTAVTDSVTVPGVPDPRDSGASPVESSSVDSPGSPVYSTLKSLLNNTLFGRDRPFRSAEFAFPLDRPRALFVTVNLVLAGAIILLMVLWPRRLGFHHGLPLLGALVLGMGYLRTMAFLSLVGIPLVLETFRHELTAESASGPVRWIGRGAVGFLLVLVVVQGWVRSRGHFTGVRMHELGMDRAARLSTGVPKFLLKSAGGRVFNHYNLGSFLVWEWWPRRKVFIDSKSSAYRANFRRQYAQYPPPELVDRHELDLVVLPVSNRWNYRYFIPQPSWRLIAFDGGMIAYRRTARARDVEPLAVLRINSTALRNRPRGFRDMLRHLCWFIRTFQNKASSPDPGVEEQAR